jgi:cobalt-precorrin-7 (C5)-methyltransferase
MAVNPAKIVIVGCGPGSPDYLTDAARQAVAQAEVLIGSRRLLTMFGDASCDRIVAEAEVSAAMAQIAALHAAGRRIAVLVSGDPGVFSLAQAVLRQFGRESCEVIPAVSSVQVAFARAGVDWADARILSAHGRTPSITPEELRHSDKIAILAGTREAIAWSAEAACTVRDSHDVLVCENLTLPGERVRLVKAEDLASVEASSLAIVLLIRRSLLS